MLVAGLLYFCCQQNGFSGCLIFFVFGELVGLIESVNCFPYIGFVCNDKFENGFE